MLRNLIDRFAYRYRLWSAESRSDNLGAGTAPAEISPKSEPAWRLIFRFLQMLAGGAHFLGHPVSLRHAHLSEPRRQHSDDVHLSCGHVVRSGIVHAGWRFA